ncbi:MAG: membrane protein insertase YidC [Candidatus Pacebacteria bacterium]|nr:membrane protein insertase YidC [Candidatus Paceibacterota bacterium]MBP9772236.1 membrane protein insertase YidC [Candidatus Paceibacterota bacterium]
MLSNIWTTIFYEPLYNALVFFTGTFGGIGLAVITLTLIVKIIMFPLTKKSILSQAKIYALNDDIEKIKKDYPDKTEQSKKTLELYKKNNVNPFSSCLVILIQLPIIIALYQVFLRGVESSTGVLYSFVHIPENLSTMFLGINLEEKSIIFAILAGITQFIQMKISTSMIKPADPNDVSFKGQLAKSMQFQMKYILPFFITFVAYSVSAAIALYWVASNIITIIQELIIRSRAGLIKKEDLLKI